MLQLGVFVHCVFHLLYACRIMRNSWGNPWGEDGLMRIVTSENKGPAGTGNNAIETACGFGVVSGWSATKPSA